MFFSSFCFFLLLRIQKKPNWLKLEFDILETVIATYMVPVRHILRSFWPISYSESHLNAISHFPVIQNNTDSAKHFFYTCMDKLWVFDFLGRLHTKTYKYGNVQHSSISETTQKFDLLVGQSVKPMHQSISIYIVHCLSMCPLWTAKQ